MVTPHRGLDVDTVVKASLAIADADGLEGLSMRRLASELEVTPMAIYHHVENKEELVDLVADESLKALPTVDVDAPWDEELKRFFCAFHRLYLDHPALAHVMSQRPIEGPTAIGAAEQVLNLLVKGGLDDDRAAAALVTLLQFTLGASLYRLSRRGDADERRRRRFATITEESAPIAYRLREKLAETAVADEHFVDGLTRLIDSYTAEAKRPARGKRSRKTA